MKAFLEVFPGLHMTDQMQELLTLVSVDRVSMTRDRSSLRVYIVSSRLIDKRNIWSLEKGIREQLFPGKQIQIRIFEKYTLSEQYTPEKLLTAYRDSLQAELKEYQELLQPILKAIEITMRSAEKVQVHMSGAKNMLAFPEFSDIQKAKSLIQTLEEKDQLVTMLKESSGNDIQIMIGSENSVQGMQDCSVITATYKMGDNTRGTIGIVGPTRMDYSQVISVLNGMVQSIEKVLRNLSDGNHKNT